MRNVTFIVIAALVLIAVFASIGSGPSLHTPPKTAKELAENFAIYFKKKDADGIVSLFNLEGAPSGQAANLKKVFSSQFSRTYKHFEITAPDEAALKPVTQDGKTFERNVPVTATISFYLANDPKEQKDMDQKDGKELTLQAGEKGGVYYFASSVPVAKEEAPVKKKGK